MSKVVVAVALALMAATAARAQVNMGDVKWGPAPPGLPAGAEAAMMSGDPSKPGTFVVRLKFPAGYVIPAHRHPASEYVTVLSGDLHLGMGDKLDKAKAASLTAGGFAVAGKDMNHYAWSDGGAVLQIQAEGPFEITYVDPKDDPRK